MKRVHIWCTGCKGDEFNMTLRSDGQIVMRCVCGELFMFNIAAPKVGSLFYERLQTEGTLVY